MPKIKTTNGIKDRKVVSRKEWLAARKKLLAKEKELTHRSDEIARQRQELPWVRIDKQYRFETDEGSASLPDLFRGRSQLLVYHFMFGPDYTAGCPSCSAIADGYNASVTHLANHDVMFWTVSRASLAKLQDYKARQSRMLMGSKTEMSGRFSTRQIFFLGSMNRMLKRAMCRQVS
jgi:predicted dithiol-disulfide oxidoreductase (DUF899 family)